LQKRLFAASLSQVIRLVWESLNPMYGKAVFDRAKIKRKYTDSKDSW